MSYNLKIAMLCVMVAVMVLLAGRTSSSHAQSQAVQKQPGWPIKLSGHREIGVVERLNIEAHPEDGQRLRISLTVRLDHFIQTLDSILKERGNLLDRYSRRVYWRGGSRILHTGTVLRMSSPIRYEQWTRVNLLFDELKTRLFSVSTDVHWRLFIEPSGLDALTISAKLENIKRVPGEIEQWFDLLIRKDIAIPLPSLCGSCVCSEVVDALSAQLERVGFSAAQGDVFVAIQLSVSGDISSVLPCLVE